MLAETERSISDIASSHLSPLSLSLSLKNSHHSRPFKCRLSVILYLIPATVSVLGNTFSVYFCLSLSLSLVFVIVKCGRAVVYVLGRLLLLA